MKRLNVFIDGSCKDIRNKDKSIGGWGYIITDDKFNIIKQDHGKIRAGKQNSNRAELEALYQALLKMKTFKGNCKFHIYSDFECLVESITGHSERKANRDYWDDIELLCSSLAGHFRISHVLAHKSSDEDNLFRLNNEVDKLAKIGANSLMHVPAKPKQIII